MTIQIIDGKTGETVKVCKTLRGARRVCDRLDNEYGAVRYVPRPIETQSKDVTIIEEPN